MANLSEMNSLINLLPWVVGLTIIVLIGLIITTGYLYRHYRQLNNRYQLFMQGNDGRTMEHLIEETMDLNQKLLKMNGEMQAELEQLRDRIDCCVQKVGLVRFNALDDLGGDLSFVLALSDYFDNGVVLATISGRQDSRIYGKPLIKGQSSYSLSAEELQAMKQAGISSEPR